MGEISPRAKEILENPEYQRAYTALCSKYYDLWREASPSSSERDYWGGLHDIVDDLQRHFEAQMGNSVIDNFQQKRREA